VTPLPTYERPPVTETVLGVQFAPLPGFTVAHLGRFWAEIEDTYPTHEIHPPLGPQMEQFEGPPTPSQVRVALTAKPRVRGWFIDAAGAELIQVQHDWFVRNWRKVTGAERYPGYEDLKPRFEADWRRFTEFLDRKGLGRPEVNQCEVTYVNDIPQGEGWSSLGEAHRVLSSLAAPKREFLVEPEVEIVNATYVMPEKKGRLHVVAQPAVRTYDRQVVLQMTLTARGRPASSSEEDVATWLDLGHEWIVRGFADLTTRPMQDRWGRIW